MSTLEGAGHVDWLGRKVFKMPEWVEPVFIAGLLFGAMFVTRRKCYSMFRGTYTATHRPMLSVDDSSRYSSDSDMASGTGTATATAPRYATYRHILGIWTVRTPNSSRFASHFHSRILQKYPFLVEMFYWVVTLGFYNMTALLSRIWFGGSKGLWDVAQDHGIAVMEIEAWASGSAHVDGTARWLEWRLQQWFLAGAATGDYRGLLLTILNRIYALVHIPGTVGFIAFYYATASNHARFCTVRRTLSLLNLFAFVIFTFFPCMPPRFLPKEYGFIDTVNAEDASSVWMSENFVNKLAAMPSMHFGYAFTVGCTLIYESGFFRQWCRITSRKPLLSLDYDPIYSGTLDDLGRDAERSCLARVVYLAVGFTYPLVILIAIIATANHYLLDAIVAIFVVLASFVLNRALINFLVLEDWLLWAIRAEKPTPTTGMNYSIPLPHVETAV